MFFSAGSNGCFHDQKCFANFPQFASHPENCPFQYAFSQFNFYSLVEAIFFACFFAPPNKNFLNIELQLIFVFDEFVIFYISSTAMKPSPQVRLAPLKRHVYLCICVSSCNPNNANSDPQVGQLFWIGHSIT